MLLRSLVHLVAGSPASLPPSLTARFPELGEASWRVGGLAVRVGGWLLGRSTVSGITLWRTIWLAESAPLSAQLLLHELRHVHQFQSDSLFPLRYLWSSLKYGYADNPYEADAREFAARRLGAAPPTV